VVVRQPKEQVGEEGNQLNFPLKLVDTGVFFTLYHIYIKSGLLKAILTV